MIATPSSRLISQNTRLINTIWYNMNQKQYSQSFVYERLKSDILEGTLKTGLKLFEIPLSRRFQVSRTPVRQAIQRLALDGLVEIHKNQSARVCLIDSNGIEAVYVVREALEGLAAYLAAIHRTESDLNAMRTALHQLETAPATAYKVHMKADAAFHTAIIQASRNTPLLQSLKSLELDVARVKLLFQAFNQSKTTHTAHHAMLEAIEAGLPEQAEMAARGHIKAFRLRLQNT